MSEMDWTNRNVQPAKLVQIGDQVEVMILEIDEDRRRVSLGMKQCRVNPWEEFAALHRKGDRISGAIKSITDFGLFVELEGGIDGLVHLSDISWDEEGEDAIRRFKKGDTVETVVLLVDPDRERISLGIKQLGTDPFSSYLASHPKGTIVSGKVIEVEARFVTVELAEGVTGSIKANDLAQERVDDAHHVVKVDDQVEALVVGIDDRRRELVLSVRAKEAREETEAMDEYRASTVASGTTNLGELLKEQLADNSE